MNHEKPTNVEIVRAELKKDPPTPRHLLPRTTGLARSAINSSIGYLIRQGELPRPTLAQTREANRASVSDTRGGISLLIEPYVLQGLKPSEIREKLKGQGIELSISRIRKSRTRTIQYLERVSTLADSNYNRTPVEAVEARKAKAKERRKSGELSRKQKATEARERKKRQEKIQVKMTRGKEIILISKRNMTSKLNKIREEKESEQRRVKIQEKARRDGEKVKFIRASMGRKMKERARYKIKKERIRKSSEKVWEVKTVMRAKALEIRLQKKPEREEKKKLAPYSLRGLDLAETRRLIAENPENFRDTEKFARKLTDNGFIEEDLFFYEMTKRVAAILGIKSLDHPTTEIIIESYVRARAMELKGKKEMMNLYEDLGKSVDSKWYNGAKFNTLRTSLGKAIKLMSKEIATSPFE